MVSAHTRLVLTVVLLAVAFHYSLATLADGFGYQSPLADLVLVPPIAICLMALVASRRRYVTAVRLTRLDLAVGGLLAALALFVLLVLPITMSKEFWTLRLDLLMLPICAAAAIVTCFGLRGAVPFAFPLSFLALAWPLPYTVLLERALDGFTHLTGRGAAAVLSLGLPFASRVGAGDGLSYQVHGPHGHDFVVGIASACSGANSLIGFFVVAVAMLAIVRGRIVNRLVWLASGLALVWLANVLRIIAIFAAGHWFGESFALDVLHPVGGLLALNLALAVNLLLLRPLRLRLSLRVVPYPLDSPLTREAPPADRPGWRQLGPRFAALAAVAAGLAFVNGSLAGVASGFDNAGVPRIAAFTARPLGGPRWQPHPIASYPWSRTFFGSSSQWVRFRLRPASAAVAAHNRFTVWADSIRTPDLGALHAHPVRRCYDFHGYKVTSDRSVPLGHGVTGELLVYRNEDGAVWHVVTWQWPIRWRGKVEHERMVLLSSTISTPTAPPPPSSSSPLASSVLAALNLRAPTHDPNPALGSSLRGIAGQFVSARIEAAETT
jgi:exosortase/archaeosortase family protein